MDFIFLQRNGIRSHSLRAISIISRHKLELIHDKKKKMDLCAIRDVLVVNINLLQILQDTSPGLPTVRDVKISI